MFYTLINYIYPQTSILPIIIEKNKSNINVIKNDNNKVLFHIDIENGVHKLAFFDAIFN